jgi:hypothetical protein
MSDDSASEYRLPKPCPLTIIHIQHLIQQHVAAMDSVNGIVFQRDWSVHDVESKLHQILPVLFQWFDNQPAQLNENDSSSGLFLPHWVLCVKVKRRLHIVPGALFPTGEQLYINSHTSQAGFKEHSVILGMMWCKILSSVYSHSFQFSNPLSHSEFHIEGLVEG